MDKAQAETIRKAMTAALTQVCKDLNVTLNKVNMTYYPEGLFRLKLEGGVVKADGNAVCKEAVNFSHLCKLYGFEPSHLGAVFRVGGKAYRLVGLRSAASKHPILASDVTTGKKYRFPTETVLYALKVAA